MHSKHKKVLKVIFEKPTRVDLNWLEIESLLIALGAVVKEGSGSRVRISLNDAVATFHRPHPKPIAKRYQVRKVEDFLRNAGVEP